MNDKTKQRSKKQQS